MKTLKLVIILSLFPLISFSQDAASKKIKEGGKFELGMRTTISGFGSTNNVGTGFGGQFRIRLGKRLNTEWYADYITENIEGLARRNDYHIGWSVMIHPFNATEKLLNPYVIVGHCFDNTKVSSIDNGMLDYIPQSESRLSAATQLGIGTNINVSDKFDITLTSQYMVHLGNDVHADILEEGREVYIEKETGGNLALEGHLLFTISVNYKIFNLW